MGKLTLFEWLRALIGDLGWQLFLWGNDITPEEYWGQIYRQEKFWREKKV